MQKSTRTKLDQQDVSLLISDWNRNRSDVAKWGALVQLVLERAPKMHKLTDGSKKNISALAHISLDALRMDDEPLYRRARAVILAHMKTYGVAKKMPLHVTGVEKEYREAALYLDEMWSHVDPCMIGVVRLSFSVRSFSFKCTIDNRATKRRNAHFANPAP